MAATRLPFSVMLRNGQRALHLADQVTVKGLRLPASQAFVEDLNEVIGLLVASLLQY